MSKSKYTEEVKKYIEENYNIQPLNVVIREVSRMTGTNITKNAIRIKASRLGALNNDNFIKIKDLDEALGTKQMVVHARKGNFTKKVSGVPGKVVNVKKFWEYVKAHERIDLTKYQRGTLLPEPKPEKGESKSWLDIRIQQQIAKKANYTDWSNSKLDRLKQMQKENKYTRKEIAEKLGITENQLIHVIRKNKLGRNIKLEITAQEVKEVKEAYAEGYSYREIGRMYSRTGKTIKKIVQQM